MVQLQQIPFARGFQTNAMAIPGLMAWNQAMMQHLGHGLQINSAERSDSQQQALYNQLHGVSAVAHPGSSTHNPERGATGLDIQNWQQALPYMPSSFNHPGYTNDPWHFDYTASRGGLMPRQQANPNYNMGQIGSWDNSPGMTGPTQPIPQPINQTVNSGQIQFNNDLGKYPENLSQIAPLTPPEEAQQSSYRAWPANTLGGPSYLASGMKNGGLAQPSDNDQGDQMAVRVNAKSQSSPTALESMMNNGLAPVPATADASGLMDKIAGSKITKTLGMAALLSGMGQMGQVQQGHVQENPYIYFNQFQQQNAAAPFQANPSIQMGALASRLPQPMSQMPYQFQQFQQPGLM